MNSSKQVEFFFDVGSPYSYLAFHALPKIASTRGARIVWRPMLLGGVFQATGNRSPIEVPAKGSYSGLDLQRWAAHFGVPFVMHPQFPINTLALMRGAIALLAEDEAEFQRYLAVVFAALFERPRDLGSPAAVAAMLADGGLDAERVLALASSPAAKEALKQATADAVARGVFGAPTFFVGDAMYWGQDRLQFVDQALA
jgi:2-hydroxychromene-2-carboxylate isomerase